MSTRRSQWITRRGQADVAAAIDQVIDQQPRPGEQVQEIPDELIEDSPYQVRQSLDETSLEELAQGMRQVGFQGVLIIRPHGDPVQRRRGSFQLVYGHRRRTAQRGKTVDIARRRRAGQPRPEHVQPQRRGKALGVGRRSFPPVRYACLVSRPVLVSA